MNQQVDRYIPHDHRCYTCGDACGRNETGQELQNGLSCLIRTCNLPYYVVCSKPECQALAANAIVHTYPGEGFTPLTTLPCCGIEMRRTPRGDRWSADDKEVTCKMPLLPSQENAMKLDAQIIADNDELRRQVRELLEQNKSLAALARRSAKEGRNAIES
jgi:hypothetical protein